VSMCNVAHLLQEQGRLSEAEALFREALDRNRRLHGDEHEESLRAANGLASVLIEQHKIVDAATLASATLERCRRLLPERDPRTIEAMKHEADVLIAQHRTADAEPLLLQAYRQIPGASPAAMEARGDIATSLVELYVSSGKPDAAEQWRQRRSSTSAPTTARS